MEQSPSSCSVMAASRRSKIRSRRLRFVGSIAELLAASRLAVRGGLDAGRVEIADGEIIGKAVLTSADLCRRAAPGETLITRSLQHLAGTCATCAALTVEA
jgi:class 3 adenylate cyclase